MSAVTLIDEVTRGGFKLNVNGGRLVIDAPTGAITDELRGLLRQHKAEIIAHLTGDSAAIFCETFWDSKSPKGAKNWRQVMPSAAHARPASAAARDEKTPRATAPTMTVRRVGCLIFCLRPRYAQTPTKHPALRLRGGRRTSMCSFVATSPM